MADLGTPMGWDDEISAEPTQFITLKPGEYEFTIKSVDKKHFDGSEKMAPCNMAQVNMVIDTEEGQANVSTNLFLNSKAEWRLSQFFECIGMKKPGQKGFHPQWNLSGWKGKCKVSNREYNGNVYNEVKQFILPKKKTSGYSGFGSK